MMLACFHAQFIAQMIDHTTHILTKLLNTQRAVETGQPELVRLMMANLLNDSPENDFKHSGVDGRSPIHEAVLSFRSNSEFSILSEILAVIRVISFKLSVELFSNR